ncbi:MAG: D-aminoacylase [Nitrospirae bacterium]|nr:MAG: D-aminoacylase [Nitrospirota bacterium]
MLDYLIKNAVLIDGTGNGPIEANIGIEAETIVFLGNGSPHAKHEINATGLIACPGFIDTHAHSEFTILADGRAEGKLSQGVTTEINGNCGLSAAPLLGEAFERRQTDMNELDIKERWHTFDEYFGLLTKKGIAINFATLCGHGNIRGSVVGYKNTAADKSSMLKMDELLADAMNSGARGLSTGLIYPPGIFSDTAELVGLAKTAKSRDGIYASHMRSEGDRLIESIEETIAIGRESGIPVHISHIKTAGERNWHKADDAISAIEKAQNSGTRVTCDRYPYIASSTDLDTVLPSWVYEGGYQDELNRLKFPDALKKIKTELANKPDSWEKIFVATAVKERNRWMEGESIAAIAAKLEKKPDDTLIEILIDEEVRTSAVFFSMNEDNLRKFLSLPYSMIGSDSSVRSFSGVTSSGKPHPRGFGSFPKIIAQYVRDEKLFSLSEAIKKMTSLPARTFRIERRGLLKTGYFADILLFDYKTIRDTATFKNPFSKPEGIEHVFVNGVHALKHGGFTGSRSGRILK